MGRRKGERRLVDPVFKMADASMADFTQTANFEDRAFHRAYINRKLPCPHSSMLINCFPAPYETQSSPNKRGKSF